MVGHPLDSSIKCRCIKDVVPELIERPSYIDQLNWSVISALSLCTCL